MRNANIVSGRPRAGSCNINVFKSICFAFSNTSMRTWATSGGPPRARRRRDPSTTLPPERRRHATCSMSLARDHHSVQRLHVSRGKLGTLSTGILEQEGLHALNCTILFSDKHRPYSRTERRLQKGLSCPRSPGVHGVDDPPTHLHAYACECKHISTHRGSGREVVGGPESLDKRTRGAE